MTTVYLPFGVADLITVEHSLVQKEDYSWELSVEVTDNKVFDDQMDDRRLARFVSHKGQFSHVMTPLDDVQVPELPNTNADGYGCFKAVSLSFIGPSIDASYNKAVESLNGILAALDEYIRAKELFSAPLDDVTEILIVEVEQ